MGHLRVDVEQAFTVAHAVGNDAEELRDELVGLQRDWTKLSAEWSGAASSAYESIWAEWVDGAAVLVDALSESSRNLGLAAADYAAQDASSAVAIDSAPIDLGL